MIFRITRANIPPIPTALLLRCEELCKNLMVATDFFKSRQQLLSDRTNSSDAKNIFFSDA